MHFFRSFKAAFPVAALVIALPGAAQNRSLSLKHGIYVAGPYSCKDAPNAAIMQWDGVGFSGAHSSRCTTRVLSRVGARFKVSTVCTALGNGTPDSSRFTDVYSIDRVSETSFSIQWPNQNQQAFRWCSVKDVNELMR